MAEAIFQAARRFRDFNGEGFFCSGSFSCLAGLR